MPGVKFNTQGKLRPFVDIGVQGAGGNFIPINMMVDTGNDITLLKKSEAARLGIDPNSGSNFQVAGISGVPQPFKMVTRAIKIGTLPPRNVRIGIGDVPDNLLGREDIAKDFAITFRGDSEIEFQTRVAIASRSVSLENYDANPRFSQTPMAYGHTPDQKSAYLKHHRKRLIDSMIKEQYFGGLLEPSELM